MLYSIIPNEEIWAEDVQSRTFCEMVIGDCKMLVEQLQNGQGRIERILSTDPQHYLDPRYQPGQIIRFY